jgi:hypothetical protein
MTTMDQDMALAIVGLLMAIDRAKGLKISPSGILEPTHPIVAQAELVKAEMAKLEELTDDRSH